MKNTQEYGIERVQPNDHSQCEFDPLNVQNTLIAFIEPHATLIYTHKNEA